MTIATATHFMLLTSFTTLVFCVLQLRQRDAASKARIARLEDIMTRLTRDELAAVARLARIERSLKDTRARQDTLATRASSGPRIESAVRVARQGSATEGMLKELGLSSSEASLLLRLHARDDDTRSEPSALGAHAKDHRTQLRPEPPPASSSWRPGSQAASLARLLASQSPMLA